jgi:hypothetical protein
MNNEFFHQTINVYLPAPVPQVQVRLSVVKGIYAR